MATMIKLKVITSGTVMSNADLVNYYTKEEVDALIPKDYITEIPSEYITEDELPDTSNFVTKAEFNTAIGNIDTLLDSINGEVV